MKQLDIFSYPNAPGWKRRGTSRAAARAMKPRAPTLRDMALGLLSKQALTADEVANALKVSVLSVRPRITELFKLGLIDETGERRANESGLKAAVWRAKA